MGQTAAHCPQPAQICASMATWSPAGAIAPVGQRSRQRVQPTIFERECAQRSSVKGHIARLVEGADEVARLEHGAEDGGGIARIGAQIAVAQIGRR